MTFLPPYASYPKMRLRRLRRTPAIREMLQEHHLRVEDLILPLFVEENREKRTPITALPGLYRETESSLGEAIKRAEDLGIRSIILFGISHNKDETGSDTFKEDGLLSRMIARARAATKDMLIISDTCFCEYTTHGHCGTLNAQKNDVDNDQTLENLKKQAIISAQAGVDILAPSGMIDGMVAALREGLDTHNFQDVSILSYSAKFASAHYGPFREATDCALNTQNHKHEHHHMPTDRKAYQMNPANADEALREVALDLQEGADMIMVKPGLPYLDIIRRIKDRFNIPVCAYQVSGEYAMLHAAAAKGWLNYEEALSEQLLAFKRAGASTIITYGALDMAKILTRT